MTEFEAIAVVQREREDLEIDSEMEIGSTERAIVEHMKDRSSPGMVEDRIAWIVELCGATGFIHVHVDDRSGDILEVIRSA